MYYIGIDLGGTNIKGALVSETGEIAREVSRPTRVELGAEAVCDGIAAVITELSSGVDRTSLGGVGLGCPGTVDDETGCVLYANNLGWKNFDLRAAVKSLIAHMRETWNGDPDSPVFINHADSPERAQELAERVRSEFGVREIVIEPLDLVIGAHSGPGTLALFFMGSKR